MSEGNDQPVFRFNEITRLPSQPLSHGLPESVNLRAHSTFPPPFQASHLPAQFRNHPSLQDRFFYTIPQELIDSVCRPQADESFELNEDSVEMESALSTVSGDHSSQIGFWNDTPISCNLLKYNRVTSKDLEGLDNSHEKVMLINRRLESFHDIGAGYAGWLMTNCRYLVELQELLSNCGTQMQRWGTNNVGLAMQLPGMTNQFNQSDWDEYEQAVLDFCIRWRLRGLAGPRIPLPMQPMMSGQFPISIIQQLMRAGGLFNWPDTYPLYARDELRDLLTDALRSNQTEHLEEWKQIISSENKAKNPIQKFERRFKFQHFYRLLKERHAQVFGRRKQRIDHAIAKYLCSGEHTIKKDRQDITNSIGAGWEDQFQPAPTL